MSARNFITPITDGGAGNPLSTSQPLTAGLWLNNGVLTYFNGTTNERVDFKDDVVSVFGTTIEDA